jgi:hypothetical protein
MVHGMEKKKTANYIVPYKMKMPSTERLPTVQSDEYCYIQSPLSSQVEKANASGPCLIMNYALAKNALR